ncbi:MAG: Phosphomannomutase [Methanophagales archaeon]|nr:Phosphomannomutase [Methanophagales archaeon]
MGAKVERIPVGHTFLTRLASQRKAIFGVESSGHFVIPEIFPFDDAMLMPLKMAEVLAKTGRKLSEIVDEMPKFYKRRVNLRCDDKIKFDVMRVLEKRLVSEFGEEKINLADGIRVDLRESSRGGAGEEERGGWVLIRASNTEPLIRITSEAGSEEKMEEQLNAFVKRTKQVINTL